MWLILLLRHTIELRLSFRKESSASNHEERNFVGLMIQKGASELAQEEAEVHRMLEKEGY